jgi:hypothetical protein
MIPCWAVALVTGCICFGLGVAVTVGWLLVFGRTLEEANDDFLKTLSKKEDGNVNYPGS